MVAHAQQLPSIESLTESYVACVQSAFRVRLSDSAMTGNLPQATEGAFLDCQLEVDAFYRTAVASAPGNTQALALVRAAVEQLKAKLTADLRAAPPDALEKIALDTHANLRPGELLLAENFKPLPGYSPTVSLPMVLASGTYQYNITVTPLATALGAAGTRKAYRAIKVVPDPLAHCERATHMRKSENVNNASHADTAAREWVAANHRES